MSIKNLKEQGILNDYKQIIQRPVALDKNQEISIYEVNFNNVTDTGAIFNGVLGSTLNEGTEGYLPKRDGTGIQVLENGVYDILFQVRNLDIISPSLSKYLFTVKLGGLIIANQGILDLYSKTTINPNERVKFTQNYVNINNAPYYITFEAECIYGTETPKNFSAYFTIIRVK